MSVGIPRVSRRAAGGDGLGGFLCQRIGAVRHGRMLRPVIPPAVSVMAGVLTTGIVRR